MKVDGVVVRLKVVITLCRCTIKLGKAVKIGARWVLHHYQQHCVVPLRKELRQVELLNGT